jgi:hypothetical protein
VYVVTVRYYLWNGCTSKRRKRIEFLVGMHGNEEPKHGTKNSREHYERGNDQPIWTSLHDNLIFVIVPSQKVIVRKTLRFSSTNMAIPPKSQVGGRTV